MIIKEIHIDGFGIFNNFSLPGLKKGVNLFIGNNEAGKSTLLKFIRFTLFGYPRSVDDRMPPLRGGNHGGRIKTALSSGKEVVFERMDSKKIRLFYDHRESQNESEWIQLLGNATGDLFNNVYAISLDELAGLDKLSASGVEDKIFSVGMGLGSVSVGEIEKNFEQQANSIYTSRGKVQLMPKILKEIEEKKWQIRGIQDNLPKYQQLTKEIGLLETEVNELTRRLNGLRSGQNKLDNYLKCYEYFIEYTDASEKLKELPELMNYPEGDPDRLKKLEEKEQDVKSRIKELINGTEDEKGIEELEKDISAIDFNQTLLEHGQEVKFLDSNLTKYITTVKDRNEDEQKVKGLNKSIKEGIGNINSSWDDETVKAYGDLVARKNRLDTFKKDFENINRKKTDLEAEIKAMRLKESAVNVKNIFSVIAGIFLVSSAPAFYYGYPVAGAAAVAIALILFFGKNYFVKKPGTTPAQLELNELQEQEKQLKEEYNDYLENELQLFGKLSPEAAMDILRSIKELKEKITERDELVVKTEKDRLPFITEFEEKTNSLSALIQADTTDSIEELARQIKSEYDKSKSDFERKSRLNEELERKKRKLHASEEELKEIQLETKNLISSFDANDAEDFRKKYDDDQRVRDLLNRKEEAVKTIETIAGFGKSVEVIEYLATVEKDAIKEGLREKENSISELEAELSQKNKELGGKKTEKEQLEGESEQAGVMTELETDVQRLNNAYQDWLANKMALKILGEVKVRYEQEKQPAVIKNSGLYFRQITEGRYPKIRVLLDKKDVSVFDEKEAVKKINQLSRGTKEQLLISLRLGFIEEYEKQSEPLPVVVDEVLVNFDPGRARQAAEILHDFGKKRQILIFTCHPQTKEFFRDKELNIIEI